MILEVENLSYYVNGKIILENITFKVNRGDFLAIIGPNGGGKSTLIRCILGFLKPQRGKISLFGEDITKFHAWYKIGYLPQRAGKDLSSLNPLTVKEFLALPLIWYKRSIDLKYQSYLFDLFGVTAFLEKKLYQLSFGQFQRVYLVRALLLKPELVFLDEPSVGLDFISQETFYKILAELHQKGLTIILITHETWLISKEVTKVACLNQRLFYHGEHKEFCSLAEKGIPGFEYHRIEHLHW